MTKPGIRVESTDIPRISRIFAEPDVELAGTWISNILQVASDNGRVFTEGGELFLAYLQDKASESLRYRFLLAQRPDNAEEPWSTQEALQRAAPLRAKQTTLVAGLLFGATMSHVRLGLINVVVVHPPCRINLGHGNNPSQLFLRKGSRGDDLYSSWTMRRDGSLANFVDAVLLAY